MAKRQLRRVAPETREKAQQLRRDQTIPELLLWSILKEKRMGGLKFRRQHPIEPYIVDFYCPAANLVIELDGESHVGRADYDESRSAYLQRLGLFVLRFNNDDVLNHLEAIGETILRAIGSASPPSKGGAGGGTPVEPDAQ